LSDAAASRILCPQEIGLGVNRRLYYEKLAEEYDHRETFDLNNVLGKLQRLRMLRVLEHVPNDKLVLDVGCGSSPILHALAEKCDVIGVDLSAKMLKRQKERKPIREMFLIVAISERLPLRTCSVDVVTCLELLEHVAEPSVLMEELIRCLKASGRILISTPNRNTNPYGFGAPDHLRAYGYRDLVVFLLDFGLVRPIRFPAVLPAPKAIHRILYAYGERCFRRSRTEGDTSIRRLLRDTFFLKLAERFGRCFPTLAFFLIVEVHPKRK